jgi:thymidine kinase
MDNYSYGDDPCDKGALAQSSCGYLEIYVGPMFSGKTSKLQELYKQFKFCNMSVEIINHCADKRYHESMLSSHDKIMIPCIQTERITDIMTHIDISNAEVILINEGQFFDDLYSCVIIMLKQNKKVYVSGLDGDFERKQFGQILDLIPMCDKITKLTALCSICRNGTAGIFSLRLTKEKQQMLIGSDNYIPVCRKCYES